MKSLLKAYKLTLTVCMIALLIVCIACSQTLLQTIEGYITTLLPVIETVANIIIATEAPAVAQQAAAAEQVVNAGVQQIETLISSINAANATTVRGQVVAIADSIKANLNGLMAAGQIKDSATQAKVTALVDSADLLVDSIVSVIPPGTTSFTAEQRVKVAVAVSNFKHQYNTIVGAKTGDAKVDRVLSRAPRFRHWYVKAY